MSSPNYTDADHTKFTAVTHGVMAVITVAAARSSTLLCWPRVPDVHDPDFNVTVVPQPGTDFHAQFIVPMVQD